jgi:hypothetical protein
MLTTEKIEDVFTYHAPDQEQQTSYELIREDAKRLAYTITMRVQVCADQQAALRKLRECVMTANAAIALRGQI